MKSKTRLLVLLALSALVVSRPILAQEGVPASEPWSYLKMPLQPRSGPETNTDSMGSFKSIPGLTESHVAFADMVLIGSSEAILKEVRR